MPLAVACLGWGSLIWKPAHHAGGPLEAQGVRAGVVEAGGSWRTDGPELPFELARTATSNDPPERYPSWVITSGSARSPALWAPLTLPASIGGDVDRALLEAATALARREGADVSQIGRWPGDGTASGADRIAAWAAAHQLDGVVWTALTPRWLDDDRPPALGEVLALLRDLVARDAATYAEEYIRKTPAQIASPFRRVIEDQLGWRAS